LSGLELGMLIVW